MIKKQIFITNFVIFIILRLLNFKITFIFKFQDSYLFCQGIHKILFTSLISNLIF
jgi:hypothetical protein